MEIDSSIKGKIKKKFLKKIDDYETKQTAEFERRMDVIDKNIEAHIQRLVKEAMEKYKNESNKDSLGTD